jgi:hypothetical protein
MLLKYPQYLLYLKYLILQNYHLNLMYLLILKYQQYLLYLKYHSYLKF